MTLQNFVINFKEL